MLPLRGAKPSAKGTAPSGALYPIFMRINIGRVFKGGQPLTILQKHSITSQMQKI